MKATRLLLAVLGLLLLVWAIQALLIVHRNASTPQAVSAAAAKQRAALEAEFRARTKKLEMEYAEKKQLATGATVYDRIFNRQGQTDVDLLAAIAKESFPPKWTIDLKVEEFTHFLLGISLPPNGARVGAQQVAAHLPPLLKYCGWLLSDVAVFDGVHKCYLFFDKEILTALKTAPKLTEEQVARICRQGETFTRLNSMTVVCEKQQDHLFMPVELSGEGGIVTSYMLLDTGASTTMISLEAFRKTGNEVLASAARRGFSTANGYMSCPIATRSVGVEGISRSIEVAVNENPKDTLNLLGLNFFAGLRYLVDMPNSCVYIWHEAALPQPNVDPTTLPSAEEIVKLAPPVRTKQEMPRTAKSEGTPSTAAARPPPLAPQHTEAIAPRIAPVDRATTPPHSLPTQRTESRRPPTTQDVTLTWEDKQRQQEAARLEQLTGEQIGWRDHSASELYDMRQAAEETRRIEQVTGERLDWRRYTASQAYDMRQAAEEIRRIEQVTGEKLDWKRYTASQAYDMRQAAEEIRRIQQITGETIDWKRYSASQAYDMRQTAEEINRLNRIAGETLDWKDYKASQAYDMRQAAETIAEINRRTRSNYRWQDYSSSDAYNLKTRLGL